MMPLMRFGFGFVWGGIHADDGSRRAWRRALRSRFWSGRGPSGERLSFSQEPMWRILVERLWKVLLTSCALRTSFNGRDMRNVLVELIGVDNSGGGCCGIAAGSIVQYVAHDLDEEILTCLWVKGVSGMSTL